MHLEMITQFRKMEPKKKYRYTYLRFEKGQHNDLIDARAVVYDIGGSFLIVPIKESVYTSESEKKRLRTVKEQIERHIGVQTFENNRSEQESTVNQESERECEGSEKSGQSSGRSKPPDRTCFSTISTYISAMTDFTFTQDDLATCVDQLSKGRHKATGQANARFAEGFVWPYSNGIINRETLNEILDRLYEHYPSYSSRDKANLFVKNFLEFLEDEKGYDLKKYLKIVRGHKPKRTRALNKFNIDDRDISNLFNHIKKNQKPLSDPQQAAAQVLFLAFTGMRQETSDRLNVKDIKNALDLAPHPSLLINSAIDKTETEHYVPLHPVLVPLLEKIIEGKDDDDKIFDSIRLATFLRNHPMPCIDKQTGNFKVKFLRKYFTQKSDEIGLDSDVSDYIQSHNLNSVTWRSYKHYTYEEIYNKYMAVWGPVNLLDTQMSDAPIDWNNIEVDIHEPLEQSLYRQIQSDLGDINYYREGIRYLNGLMPSKHRIEVDDYTPSIDDIKNTVHIRLEKYVNSIETEEEYKQRYLEELKKEARKFSDLATEEERRYQELRAAI